MYGMTPVGVFFTAIFPLVINGQALCQQLHAVPKSVRKLMLLISYLVQLAFFIAVLLGAAEYLPTVATQTSAVLHLPLDLVYIVIPITAVCTAIFCVRDMVLLIMDKGENKNG